MDSTTSMIHAMAATTIHDENATVTAPSKMANDVVSFSKTPRTIKKFSSTTTATTTARRALGDISNRKSAFAPSMTTIKTNHVVNKPTAATLFKPPLTVTTSSSSPAVVAAGHRSDRRLLHPPQLPQPPVTRRAVVFDENIIRQNESESVKLPLDNHEMDDSFDYGPIEQPAGRLWSQQTLDNELHEHDDDAQSTVSLEGAATFRQEWSDALRSMHEQRLRDLVPWNLDDSLDDCGAAAEAMAALDDEDRAVLAKMELLEHDDLLQDDHSLWSSNDEYNEYDDNDPFNLCNNDDSFSNDAALLRLCDW